MKSHLWLLSQNDTCLLFRAIPDVSQEFGEDFIKDYFQWDVNLAKLYADWTEADEKFADVATNYKGVRILRQDPVENVFCFICSSNNNIQRYL
jgi:N-glycosylase/DNA lyase